MIEIFFQKRYPNPLRRRYYMQIRSSFRKIKEKYTDTHSSIHYHSDVQYPPPEARKRTFWVEHNFQGRALFEGESTSRRVLFKKYCIFRKALFEGERALRRAIFGRQSCILESAFLDKRSTILRVEYLWYRNILGFVAKALFIREHMRGESTFFVR